MGWHNADWSSAILFFSPYMAVPAFVIWLVLLFKEVHFDTYKAFEKYLVK